MIDEGSTRGPGGAEGLVPDRLGPAPVIVLVEPQLAENIGMAARAMANFGLAELRLVAPRGGWPAKGAREAASGAGGILDRARVFGTVPEAVADLNFVLATTARARAQMKRVLTPREAIGDVNRRGAAGERVGILFGPERTGLGNNDISLADAVVTFPVNPAFPSLNLAQAVLLVGYEWFQHAAAGPPAFAGDRRTPPASRAVILSFFDYLEAELEAVNFYPPDKKASMTRNMRDIFHRMALTEQDIRTLRGVVRALIEARRLRKP